MFGCVHILQCGAADKHVQLRDTCICTLENESASLALAGLEFTAESDTLGRRVGTFPKTNWRFPDLEFTLTCKFNGPNDAYASILATCLTHSILGLRSPRISLTLMAQYLCKIK